MKKCCKCKQFLELVNFRKRSDRNGLRACCKSCEKHYKKPQPKEKRLAYYTKLKSRELSQIKIPDTKQCSTCSIIKKNQEFSKSSRSVDGLNYNCKNCDKQKRLKNEERLKNRSSFSFPDEKFCVKCKITKNKESFSIVLSREDGLTSICKDCQKLNSAKRRITLSSRDLNNIHSPDIKTCPDCSLNLSCKNFGKSVYNIDGLNTYCKTCSKNRYGLRNRLSGRIRTALKRHLIKKSTRTIDLIGCSIDYLKKYLESKFTDNMSWEAFSKGQIHIDHITPCSSFDLTDKNEQIKCFHYTNLQPLWAKDNLVKSNKQ